MPGLRAVEFSTVKLLFLPFAYCTLWEKVTMCSPCWADTKIMLHAEQTQKLFGIMLHGRFVSLTYLLDHSFISAWIHGYLFYTLGYKPIWLFFFLAQVCPALAIRNSFYGLLCPFVIPDYCVLVWCWFRVLFLAFSYFQTLLDRCSTCIFPAPVLKISHFSKEP